MAEDALGPIWSGLVWLGGGIAFHLLKRYCGREIEALANAHKVSCIKELSHIAAKDGSNRPGGVVAVVGKVGSEAPINCKNSRVPAVVLEESIEQFYLRQVNGNNWVKDSTYLAGSKQQSPWYLEDSTGRIFVEGARHASGFNLVIASDVVEDAPPASTMRSVIDIAQGIKILCIRRVERILPVGTSLTVVGEPVKLSKDRIAIRRPRAGGPFFVTTSSLDLLVSGLGTSSVWCKWLSISCTALGIATLAAHAIRYFKERRRERRERAGWAPPPSRRQRSERNPPAEGIGYLGEEGENGNGLQFPCVICLDNEYNVAFFPCGHVCCCKDCVEVLSQCPLCRQRINQKKFVYLH